MRPRGYDTKPDTRDIVQRRFKAQIKSEVFRYRELAPCDKDESPLAWLFARRDSFPLIEELAICVHASSASSERLFSKAGLTLTKKRMKLKPSRVAQLVTVRGAITSGLLDKY